ncbi:hypothetical protein PanWU01x14_341480 [Parasponia andersonii]|uniref:Uncharacterized protein n=1 Tax=Parasponia andersonii TaxID=3476 RepID=A0A2P5AE28_PARAD|nr:hypothetical protein PanWU01x14_341480 [Parasponia andersonii]
MKVILRADRSPTRILRVCPMPLLVPCIMERNDLSGCDRAGFAQPAQLANRAHHLWSFGLNDCPKEMRQTLVSRIQQSRPANFLAMHPRAAHYQVGTTAKSGSVNVTTTEVDFEAAFAEAAGSTWRFASDFPLKDAIAKHCLANWLIARKTSSDRQLIIRRGFHGPRLPENSVGAVYKSLKLSIWSRSM